MLGMLRFGQLLGQGFKPRLQLFMMGNQRLILLIEVVHLMLQPPGCMLSALSVLLVLFLVLR